MHPSTSPITSESTRPRDVHAVFRHLQSSEIFRDFQKAYELTTGLPLALRENGSFQPPLQGSKRINPFCALMATANKSCAACLQLQERVEVESTGDANTLECFAGLHESAVPVRVGDNILGYLQTGQIFFRAPSREKFERIAEQLEQWGVPHACLEQLEFAYFQTRVMGKPQYDATLRLLTIFARHLASLGNQIVVTAQLAELPAITRARTYIAEKQSEDLTLRDVARVAGMNAFYFCKLFRRTTGLTFTNYLARLRIESVKRMLLNPHMRMSEAAYAAGFQSLSQFNRVFHRLVGESPSSFHHRLHSGTNGASRPFAA